MTDKKVRQPLSKGVAKVPVVMQMEDLECGAACLCMILAYYKKWIPLEQVRKDCDVSRDGSKAGNILRAARAYGMQANGFKYKIESLRTKATFPCIVFWNCNHFVVLDGIKGNKFYINDPAKGNYNVDIDTFMESYSDICLKIEPGEDFEPSGKPKSVLGFAFKYLKDAKLALFFLSLTIIIAALASIFNAGFSRFFLDQLLTGRDPEWTRPFFISLSILTVIQIISAWIQAVYSLRLDGKMAVVGNASYMWKILKLPMEFFSQRMAGDIQLRKMASSEIAGELVGTVAPLTLSSGMMIFYLVIMLRYSVMLTMVGLISIILQVLVSQMISLKRINITRVMMRDSGKLQSATTSGIEMIETIKAQGAENGYFEKWAGYQASVNTQNVRYQKLDEYLGIIPTLLSDVMNMIILILGIWLAMRGKFTEGMILAFQGFLVSFTNPARKLIEAGQSILEMRSNMERIEDVMNYPEDDILSQKQDENEILGKLNGELELKNVTFGYSRLSPPLIEDFNLKLKPGQRVAFVGASGCGKSTLAKLISGLYRPWSGEVIVGGKPISEISKEVFTGSVAVVDQDITLFEDTIANNIKMWSSSIADFEMLIAARDVQLHEDIMEREGGYQYMLMEGGKDFSGGQRQRIEIARVLAQDPTMIIMDEATSALDAKTEYQIMEAIKARGITCIIIAHRLSTIRDCDEIIVLDKGKVVERGTHEQLMKLKGSYEKLVLND